jgi:hypothetical protein
LPATSGGGQCVRPGDQPTGLTHLKLSFAEGTFAECVAKRRHCSLGEQRA